MLLFGKNMGCGMDGYTRWYYWKRKLALYKKDLGSYTRESSCFLRSKICQIILWSFYKKIFKGEWSLFLDNGSKFIYRSEKGFIPLSFSFSGITDYREMKFLRRYLREGDYVFDCGANQGLYSIYMAKLVGEKGKVVAIEPCERFIQSLNRNKNENKFYCIEVHPVAAANKEGKTFFVENGPYSRLDPKNKGNDSMPVEVRRLEDLLDDRIHYVFGKIDVEGAELFVLQGLTKMLQNANPPAIQIEITNLTKDYGYSAYDLKEFLLTFGYHIYLYTPWSNNFICKKEPWKHCLNPIAIHQREIEFVQSRLKGKA